MANTPNFSADRVRAFPWSALRRLSRDEAEIESALARWFASPWRDASRDGAAWPRMRRLLRLDPGAVLHLQPLGSRDTSSSLPTTINDDSHAATKNAASAYTPTAFAIDPHAAICVVNDAGLALEVSGSSAGVRAIVQRLMGGPEELAAPRPLGVVEKSLWSLVVATALEDLDVEGHVWPHLGPQAALPALLARPGAATAPTAQPATVARPVNRAPGAGKQAAATPTSSPAAANPTFLPAAANPTFSPAAANPTVLPAAATAASSRATTAAPTTPLRLLFDVRLGDIALAVEVRVPREILVRVPPRTAAELGSWGDRGRLAAGAAAKPAWGPRGFEPPSVGTSRPAWVDRVTFDLLIVVGRCALHREDLARLAPRSVVTLERPVSTRPPAGGPLTGAQADLEFFGGAIGLRARPGALVAEVVTGYVRRDMALPDQAHVELTVALGTTQLSLREVTELAIGQIVQLGRPLAGPFELRAAGRVLGRGELVDVDGELAVRIVSLGEEE